VPENPALELWQRLCVPSRCRGLLLGFAWITDRFGDLTEEQVADSARTSAEIGVLLHGRLLAGEAAPSEDQLPARQGEHNIEVLTKLGYSTAAIAALHDSGALIQPGRVTSADDAADPCPGLREARRRPAPTQPTSNRPGSLQGGE
jgi:hypothetical protein